MKAKHIIQVSAYYPPHLGGQENAVHDLAHQLACAGHRVEVLTSTVGGGLAGTHSENGANVCRLRGFVFGHAAIMPWFPLALYRRVQKDSVVHIHIGQAFTPEMVWLVSKLRGFRYIAELHIDFEPSGPTGVLLPLYKRFVLKRVLHSAHAVIVLNEKTLHIVRDAYGYQGKAYIMTNGIDEAYFEHQRLPFTSKPPGSLRLLFVGRLSPQKNITGLLKALKITTRKVHVDVIGDGTERAVIQQTISDYGLTNVTMHGRLERRQIMQFYKTCDALIMPSLYEAQPLVLLEAMAAKIPIIGSNVIGVADHIKGVGIIAAPSPQGLADGIAQYDEQYALLPAMVERGHTIAESLRWVHTLGKYEALYQEVT